MDRLGLGDPCAVPRPATDRPQAAAGRILTDTERRWVFWTPLAPTVVAAALPVAGFSESLQTGERVALLLGAPIWSIMPSVILLGAIGIWLGLHDNPGTAPVERFVAVGAAAKRRMPRPCASVTAC